MEEVEIIGTFDCEDTTRLVAKALNLWFAWVIDGDPNDAPDIFDDFGISAEEFALDKETDIDWTDTPIAIARSNKVIVTVETSSTIDILSELIEALGAYDVNIVSDEE